MRWKNKGHEFDEYWKRLKIDSTKELKFYIWGAGHIGKYILTMLKHYKSVIAFVDTDVKKIGTEIEGIPIISLEEYKRRNDARIILAVAEPYLKEMVQQMITWGKMKNQDYYVHDEFVKDIFPVIALYYYDELCIRLSQIALTERCTLKCKNCCHGCYAVDNRTAKDMTLEQAMHSADSFFSHVAFVQEFTLLGGEPLLYSQLDQVITYIGRKYREQIGHFYITTNGSIMPSQEILELCKKYKVSYLISNYSKQIPDLGKKLCELANVLESKNIEYSVIAEDEEWIDFGFTYVNNNSEKAARVFDGCETTCREVRENRFYYCVMARSISENLGWNIGNDDYFNLDEVVSAQDRKLLFEYDRGYSDKGYLEVCKHCQGMGKNNLHVPAGEQL